MIIKILIGIAFIGIIFSLGSALYHLVKRTEENSTKTVKALTVRITLSVLLFIFLFIAVVTGLIEPHGIGARLHNKTGQEEIKR